MKDQCVNQRHNQIDEQQGQDQIFKKQPSINVFVTFLQKRCFESVENQFQNLTFPTPITKQTADVIVNGIIKHADIEKMILTWRLTQRSRPNPNTATKISNMPIAITPVSLEEHLQQLLEMQQLILFYGIRN